MQDKKKATINLQTTWTLSSLNEDLPQPTPIRGGIASDLVGFGAGLGQVWNLGVPKLVWPAHSICFKLYIIQQLFKKKGTVLAVVTDNVVYSF